MMPGKNGDAGSGGSNIDLHFPPADSNALKNQILAVHAFDGNDNFDAKLIISMIKQIIHYPESQVQIEGGEADENLFEGGATIYQEIGNRVNEIYCEIINKCSDGGNHFETISLLRSLSNYSFGAKAAIALAAFSINYGEFCLVKHLNAMYPLAKDLSDLMDFPHLTVNDNKLNNKLENIFKLLNVLVNIADCIIEVEELFSHYKSQEMATLQPLQGITALMDYIPEAVYWIIKSLLTCASALLDLFSYEANLNTAISALTPPAEDMLEQFQNQLKICNDFIRSEEEEKVYREVKKSMNLPTDSNLDILKILFRSNEDQKPLYNGSKQIKEPLDVLKYKTVMLLISELEFPQEPLNILCKIYDQIKDKRAEYDIVWLPLVRTAVLPKQKREFDDLRNKRMPWYSVDHPSLVHHGVVRYIIEEWKFDRTPRGVVLGPEGKISNFDALPMLWIWGIEAFPFNADREKVLWEEIIPWNLELLAGDIYPHIHEWIVENKIICLYGGDGEELIREFTLATKNLASALHVPIEMLYISSWNDLKDISSWNDSKERARRLYQVIVRENLSNVFPAKEYYNCSWHFWERLRSMWRNGEKFGYKDNGFMKDELNSMVSFQNSEMGWAVFSRGNHEMTKGNLKRMLSALHQIEELKNKVEQPDKFVKVLDEMLAYTDGVLEHCNHLIIPLGTNGQAPQTVICAECGKLMESYIMFSCCMDEE